MTGAQGAAGKGMKSEEAAWGQRQLGGRGREMIWLECGLEQGEGNETYCLGARVERLECTEVLLWVGVESVEFVDQITANKAAADTGRAEVADRQG